MQGRLIDVYIRWPDTLSGLGKGKFVKLILSILFFGLS